MSEFKSGELENIRKQLIDLFNNIPIRFYIAEPVNFIYEVLKYPYRLISANDLINKRLEIKEKLLKKIYLPNDLILDSGIFNDNIDNELILKISEKYHPKYVVPKDYFGNSKKTIESVKNFLNVQSSYSSNSDVLIPLQDPWVISDEFEKFDYFAIGGIIKLRKIEKINTIRKIVRRYPLKMFHLFGVQPMTMCELIRRNSNIVSMDVAIARDFIYSRGGFLSKNKIYSGKYSGLTEKFAMCVGMINQVVGYYNYYFGEYDEGNTTQTRLF